MDLILLREPFCQVIDYTKDIKVPKQAPVHLVGWDNRSTDLTIHYQVNTIAMIIGLLQRVLQ